MALSNRMLLNRRESWGKLQSLRMLHLSQNSFICGFPESFSGEFESPGVSLEGSYQKLQVLDLLDNGFTGGIPSDLNKLEACQSSLPPVLYHLPQSTQLPAGGFFSTISLPSVSGNPALRGSLVDCSCPAFLPKPIVLSPNSSSDSAELGSLSPNMRHKKIILSISAIIAIGAAVVIALGVVAVTVLNIHTHRRYQQVITTAVLVMFLGDPDFSAGAYLLLRKDCELGLRTAQKVWSCLQDRPPEWMPDCHQEAKCFKPCAAPRRF
ncbi:hypothetical protein MKW98_009771 [Papaver atlanticum]|uniref:Uncharacterized protein n=1 Tax=Papaver atlanticum TaxID=357466 RepID=A0AAD4SV83_9MAGN|nr:hypothetical protein MKW98_009771 [Papaver atlanticum]